MQPGTATAGVPAREGEHGFILLIGIVATILPLLVVLGAASVTMSARNARLDNEVNNERALTAAESGVDAAIYRSSTSTGLITGVGFSRNLGNGMSFHVMPTFLRADGVDNDGDLVVDEADENVFRVVASGTYRKMTRRLVAYLGPQPIIKSIPGSVTCLDSGYQIQVQDNATIVTGIDTNMNGSPGAGPSVPGIAVEPPTTTGTVLSWLEDDHDHVQGSTPTPSVAQSTNPITDWNAIKLAVQNSANLVLTSEQYAGYNFGNGLAGQFNIIYRGGKVQFKNCQGAGVMFINGDLQIDTNFRFDGIIYVGGKIQLQGNPTIYGAIVVGTACEQIQVQGASKIYYSTEAIAKASAALPGKYVLFNGWQEISRN